MDELLKKLAEQTGMDLSTATNGLGAVIAFLKQHLPANVFGQVTEAVPEAHGMIDTFEANKVESAGGCVMAAVTGLAGKLLGQGVGARWSGCRGIAQNARIRGLERRSDHRLFAQSS